MVKRQDKKKETSLSYHWVALSSLEKRIWKQQLTQAKKLSVSRTVEMITMFFRAKKKNEATCKKSHGPEHKMNAWKGMGYSVV
jgi:hypothetical protein